MTGWGCETRSGWESGRLKCRSAETPWALVSAGLAVFEKDLGHWPLRQPADPCHQSISRPALWRAGDSWDGRALQAADAAGMSLRAALIAVDRLQSSPLFAVASVRGLVNAIMHQEAGGRHAV